MSNDSESLEPAELAIRSNRHCKQDVGRTTCNTSLWIRARATSGAVGFGEGCPREYVTAESMSTALAFVERHREEWLAGITSLGVLAEWVRTHVLEIDANPAAWTAVELALLDLLGKEQQMSVEGMLGLPELTGRFCYTAVIGDGPPAQFSSQLDRYLQQEFRSFKIKLSRGPVGKQGESPVAH